MTPAAPAVALLFDDVELGGHLREALNERGARIVHEGAVSGFSRALLERVMADVLVVNLDDVADDALDNLYEAIDGTNQKVVFNDGQASSALTGWDRARWARHLALKVFEIGEVDPPRPDDARSIETPKMPLTVDAGLTQAQASTDAVDSLVSDAELSNASAVAPQAASADSSNSPAAASAALRDEAAQRDTDSFDAFDSDAFTVDLSGDDQARVEALHVEANPSDEFSAQAFSTSASVKEVAGAMDAAEPSWSVETLQSPANKEIEPALSEMFLLDDLPPSFEGADDLHGNMVREESENLAAELEALLASGDLVLDDEETPSASGLRFSNDEEPPMLHDGHFGLPQTATVDGAADDDDFDFDALETSFNAQALPVADAEAQPSAVTPPVFQLDQLALAPLMDTGAATAVAKPVQTSVGAPAGWSLMENDAPAAASPQTKSSPADFGIEKMSAADFLAPDTENAGPDSELVMSLDRISMEEAMAPKDYQPIDGMQLDSLDSELSQIVLLGAVASGADSVGHFLESLPADTDLCFLHTQHFGAISAETMVANLAILSSLPVRLAKHGMRAKGGEVLVVPPGQQLRLLRDGSVELQPSDARAAKEASIDASFTMAAGVFKRDALAIVFAGRGNDGVAGSQAVKDRGGKVWVESPSGDQPADVVSGIVAERLVSFSGSPHELAAHLIEVYP